MPTHSSLTGSELHENKGVSSASTNAVATAVSGATVWQKVKRANLDPTEFYSVNVQQFTLTIPNTATAADYYVVVPFACTVTNVYGVSSTAPSGSTGTVTLKQNGGSTMVSFTTPSTDPANTAYSQLVSSSNTLTAGQFVKVSSSGSGTGAGLAMTILVEVTG